MMPLLEGLDGINKMSKSLGNYIGIDEDAKVMFEKIMTIPDELIVKYFELVTDIHPDEVEKIKELLRDGTNPRDIKMQLGREIVELYHGKDAVKDAEDRFKLVFQRKEIPDDIKCVEVSKENLDLAEIITNNLLVKSKNEFRRLVVQGGVKVNGEKLGNIEDLILSEEMIIQIGKKKFIKIIIK